MFTYVTLNLWVLAIGKALLCWQTLWTVTPYNKYTGKSS